MQTLDWSGSREPYFGMYLEPFRGLANHRIGAVRRFLRVAKTGEFLSFAGSSSTNARARLASNLSE
jgi:hypothetical protein